MSTTRTLTFSIRDLVWATLVTALIIGWWLDRNSVERKNWEATRKIADYFEALDRRGVDDELFFPPEKPSSETQATR